jgi:hypothetical protein
MITYGEVGGLAPFISKLGLDRRKWSPGYPIIFILERISLSMHLIGGKGGLEMGLDSLANRKIPYPAWNGTPFSPSFSPYLVDKWIA